MPTERETLADLIASGSAPPQGFSEADLDLAETMLAEGAVPVVEFATARIKDCSTDGAKGYTADIEAGASCHTHDGSEAGIAKAKGAAMRDAMKAMPSGSNPKMSAREFALETVDLSGVQILAAGGPYHGTGSPPEGDHYTVKDLQRMAEVSNQLATEVRAPLKIGHSADQKLLSNSGLSRGEEPAAGWMENYRVEDGKLLADIRNVPRKIADLVKAKAFRTRSVELGPVKSQSSPRRVHKNVVLGLALLGAQRPAIRTLDDIIAQYEQATSTDIRESLGLTPDGSLAEALMSEDEEGDDGLRSVDYADDDDLREALVEIRLSLAELADRGVAKSGDTSGVATQTKKKPLEAYSDEQIESLAKAFEIDEADVDKRREAVAAKFTEAVKETPDDDNGGDGDGNGDGDGEGTPPAAAAALPAGTVAMSAAEVEVLRAGAEAGTAAAEELRKERVDRKLTEAVTEGRLDPAKKERWEKFFADNEEQASEMLAELPVNQALVKVYGADAETGRSEDDDVSDEVMRMFGLSEYVEAGS